MKRGSHQIIVGDCLTELAKLPAGHFHACMTSPPYFALRSYLPAGHPDKDKEIGSEPTPEQFIATMVAVFREVRRVLRDDGFLWVNLGDSYDAGGRVGHGTRQGYKQQTNVGTMIATDIDRPTQGMAGQQLLMPHRVALALQADGWVLRDTIIWNKRTAMPQSVNGVRWQRHMVKVSPHQRDTGWSQSTDGRPQSDSRHTGPYEAAEWEPCPGCKKCNPHGGYILRRGQARTCTAHEYVFLLTKGNRYFVDMENWREKAVWGTPGNKTHRGAEAYLAGDEKMRTKLGLVNMGAKSKRVRRSVWTLTSEPSPYRHFATMPSELVHRCLLALSAAGCCPHCGDQWAPVVEMIQTVAASRAESFGRSGAVANHVIPGQSAAQHRAGRDEGIMQSKVIGYRPTCSCNAGDPVPCRTLDPFSGTSTTGQTACFLGHDYVGIELNPDYAAHAEEWINREPRWSLRQKTKAAKKTVKPSTGQGLLF